MKTPIYLDNHATTQMDPRVLDAMLPYFTEYFGNAASRNHEFGWVAEQAVDKARKQIADLIGASPREIIFTSGATESDNLAIKGVAEMYAEKGNHIITAATEHKAVLDTCKKLEKNGYRVTYLPVKGDGLIDLDMLRESITDKTILVTIMYANNEIGVIQPVAEIGKICREKGVLFHTDGVQAIGKVPVDVNKDNIDLMSITAHKLYGPKGVGALYVRRESPRVQLTAQMDGGGHERGMRSGTLNVPGIVGLGEACAICQREMPEETKRLRVSARQAEEQARSGPRRDLSSTARWEHRLPHSLNHELRVCGRRIAADGHQRCRGFERFGLHFGDARTELRVEGAGPGRRYRAFVDPLRHRPVQHGRRDRLRGGQADRCGPQTARAFAAVRDGERRHRSQQGFMGSRLSRSYRRYQNGIFG